MAAARKLKTATRTSFARKKWFPGFALLALLAGSPLRAQDSSLNGRWTLVREKSTDIDSYTSLALEFEVKEDRVTILQEWGAKKIVEQATLLTGGRKQQVEIRHRLLPPNIFMGVKLPVGGKKEVSAEWQGAVLKVVETYEIISSQGGGPLRVEHFYEPDPAGNALIYRWKRDTRVGGPEARYLLRKADRNQAYVMKMSDNWEIDGRLPEQACLISLQGVVNEEKSALYFLYGEAWDYRFTPAVHEYLRDVRLYSFTPLGTLEQALTLFRDRIRGYIVWDRNVRTSLIVAFTLAGLEKGIVVSEDLLPLVRKIGLQPIEDFRGKFSGQTDYEIYRWAYDRYWGRCSRDFIVWLGGEHGKVLKPGVADFGMTRKAFFTDLSSKASDVLECELTQKLFADMKPLALVMGWHSYKKDLEETFVTLTSRFGLRMEGLHTLPNMSFMGHVPLTPGFRFRNNHTVKPGRTYVPEEKVYLTFIQTDCLGLGAWTRPGRGSIPYTWEVTMNWSWLAPAMLEYFYSQATPNDYFLGALSGPGYLYPKAFPKAMRPGMISMARELMAKLDLNAFEIMDYSEEGTIEGPSELTAEVIDQYYRGMPDAIGFINGYRPSHTFAVRDKRPLISYDYYLSPSRPEEDAAADLKELARINPRRPYFLAAHIRQSSDITRVKSIYERLGPEFQLVPLDLFLKMAGEKPTFAPRVQEGAR